MSAEAPLNSSFDEHGLHIMQAKIRRGIESLCISGLFQPPNGNGKRRLLCEFDWRNPAEPAVRFMGVRMGSGNGSPARFERALRAVVEDGSDGGNGAGCSSFYDPGSGLFNYSQSYTMGSVSIVHEVAVCGQSTQQFVPPVSDRWYVYPA